MIKSPTEMKGYYKMPEETAKQVTKDGWLHTGDLGKIGSDGYLYHKGRTKEMVKRSGWSIFPTEVEDIISMVEHTGLRNVLRHVMKYNPWERPSAEELLKSLLRIYNEL